MPLVEIPLQDDREPGRTLQAAAWAHTIIINARAETIALGVEVFSSPAAYAAGAKSSDQSHLFAGEDYRAIVRENPELWGLLAGLADRAVQSRIGGDVVPATLPAWAGPES